MGEGMIWQALFSIFNRVWNLKTFSQFWKNECAIKVCKCWQHFMFPESSISVNPFNKKILCCNYNKVNPGKPHNVHHSLTLPIIEMVGLELQFTINYFQIKCLVLFSSLFKSHVFLWMGAFDLNAAYWLLLLGHISIRAATKPWPFWTHYQATIYDIKSFMHILFLVLLHSNFFIFNTPFQRWCCMLFRFLAYQFYKRCRMHTFSSVQNFAKESLCFNVCKQIASALYF